MGMVCRVCALSCARLLSLCVCRGRGGRVAVCVGTCAHVLAWSVWRVPTRVRRHAINIPMRACVDAGGVVLVGSRGSTCY
jgi:hypothetical protein